MLRRAQGVMSRVHAGACMCSHMLHVPGGAAVVEQTFRTGRRTACRSSMIMSNFDQHARSGRAPAGEPAVCVRAKVRGGDYIHVHACCH